MAMPQKTPNINHGRNRTRIDDLDDDMLTQILVRLPNCETVQVCSPVNKRWRSLISDPNFQDLFVNHKKKTTTLLKGSGYDHEDAEPPWTFVVNVIKAKRKYFHDVDNEIKFFTKFERESRKLSLEFLPCCTSFARATFKDLVLCSDYKDHQGGGRVYYITNPLTKQWVALPPCHKRKKGQKRNERAAFICQSPYKFRIVEVRYPVPVHMDHSTEFVDLVVYCSEIGEWKEIKLRIPKEVGPVNVNDEPEIVVCNGIVYFKSRLSLVAMDPFDVNDACDTTLDARVMPPLPDFGYLRESSGQLLVVHNPIDHGVRGLNISYRGDGTKVEYKMVVWKLDPNQAPLVWETTFRGLCKGTASIDLPNYTRSVGIFKPWDFGGHPYNDKLIYMHISLYQVVLCDTRTGCITPSKSFPNYYLGRFYRLDHQWWPTSVPALVQCLKDTQSNRTSNDNC